MQMNSYLHQGEIIYKGDQSIRLDLFLANSLPGLSRSQIQRSIENGGVTVDGVIEKSKYKLISGDIIKYSIDDGERDISHIPAEDIPLDIIYENDDVIVINKKAGLATHPTPSQTTNTLVNALLGYYNAITEAIYEPDNPKSSIRAGIVHRLDKNTTGVMIVAKNARALRSLSSQIKHRHVDKKYIALCFGSPDEKDGQLINFLGRDPKARRTFSEVGESKGKKAILNYKIVSNHLDKSNRTYSLIEFSLITGRTHQIRAQSRLWGYPIIGDDLYYSAESRQASSTLGANRQLLHSYRLSITLPGGTKPSLFEAPLPSDLVTVLKNLQKL